MLYICSFVLVCALLTLLSISDVGAFRASLGHDLSPRAMRVSSDHQWLTCFTQDTHPGIQSTNLTDCHGALRELILQPDFTRSLPFSRHGRVAIKVPKGWKERECTIYVSCGNDYDTDTFTYADVAHTAANIINTCILDRPDTEYGGLAGVGGIGSFYVAVGKTGWRPILGIENTNRSAAVTVQRR